MRAALPLLVVLALTASCSLEEHYTGLGDGALPGDPLKPTAVPCVGGGGACSCADTSGTPDVAPGELDVDDLTGYAWRIDSLVFSAPSVANGALIPGQLNDVVADQFEKRLANVLLLVEDDDRTAGTMSLRVGAGNESGQGLALTGEGSLLGCTLEGARFTTDIPGALDFPTELAEPPRIPIRGMRLSGTLSADGEAIESGALVGVLTEEDAATTKLAGTILLSAFLTSAGLALDGDADGDGTLDGWRFVGAFTATRTTVE